jgi:ElaB/YqjD/DUF883 family membrane-anchored ribosome-binding protein
MVKEIFLLFNVQVQLEKKVKDMGVLLQSVDNLRESSSSISTDESEEEVRSKLSESFKESEKLRQDLR